MTALQEEPSLAHLAYYAATSFIPSHGMECKGKLWGRSGEGQTQGSPEAGPMFAVTVQESCASWTRRWRLWGAWPEQVGTMSTRWAPQRSSSRLLSGSGPS